MPPTADSGCQSEARYCKSCGFPFSRFSILNPGVNGEIVCFGCWRMWFFAQFKAA